MKTIFDDRSEHWLPLWRIAAQVSGSRFAVFFVCAATQQAAMVKAASMANRNGYGFVVTEANQIA